MELELLGADLLATRTTSTTRTAARTSPGFARRSRSVFNNYGTAQNLFKEVKNGLTGRGHPRRAHRGHQHQAPGPALRLADEEQARLERGEDHRRDDASYDKLGQFFEENPADRAEDHREGHPRRQGARGGAQGARGRPQGAARLLDPLGQARRLPDARPERGRDLHRRGGQRRRLREAGARPEVSGDPAAQGEDPERRARAPRQDALVAPRSARSSPRSAAASAAREGGASTSRSSATTRSS